MSRYLILLLLNMPLVLAALFSAFIEFKMEKYSKKKFIGQTLIWLLIFAGLASAQLIYKFLFSNSLTSTEPLSLFDVIQITGIVTLLFMVNRSRIKIEAQERRLQDLHQELSIRLSETVELRHGK